MRIFFAGTPENAAQVLQALIDSSHEVVGVLTRPAKVKGRGRKVIPSPVQNLAEAAGLPVFTPTTLRNPDERPDLASFQADVCIVVAYGVIIPADLLEVFPCGWINLHYSLLPTWRGAAPVQQAIWRGEKETGVSIFRIEEGLDTGPLLLQASYPIGENTTSDELLEELTQLGIKKLVELLPALESGQANLTAQVGETGEYARTLNKADGLIQWDNPAEQIHNQIRAFTSNPGAYTFTPDGKRLVIRPGRIGTESTLEPGEVQVHKNLVTVGTASFDYHLEQVVPAGKKPMRAADWGRGIRFGESWKMGEE